MTNKIKLEEKLDSSAAEALLSDITDALGEELVLDASAVAVLGGLCLEVLMCAKQVWREGGECLSIDGPSEDFSEHLQRFGLSVQDFLVGERA